MCSKHFKNVLVQWLGIEFGASAFVAGKSQEPGSEPGTKVRPDDAQDEDVELCVHVSYCF